MARAKRKADPAGLGGTAVPEPELTDDVDDSQNEGEPDDLFDQLANSESAALSAYAKLAERIAAGESVPADEARGVLLACGKSAADLQARVARLKRVAALDVTITQYTAVTAKRGTLDAARAVALQAELSDWRELQRSQKEAHATYMAEIGRIDTAARNREVAAAELAGLDRQLAAEIAGPAAPTTTPTAPQLQQQGGGFSFQSRTHTPVAGGSAEGVIW